MSMRWQRLGGDTSRFAFQLSLGVDPSPGTWADPDMSASWGGFAFWVFGQNLCLHVEEGEQVDAVHWYLLPLLEWLTSHWNPLLHEERLPVRNAGDNAAEALRVTRFPPPWVPEDRALSEENEWHAWWSRHSLRAARSGGLFPDVHFRRWRDQIEVSWTSEPVAGAPDDFRFLASGGIERLTPEDMAKPMGTVAREAVDHLLELVPTSERLLGLQRRLNDLSNPRANRRERLGWLSGMGRDSATVTSSWLAVTNRLRSASSSARRAVLNVPETGWALTGSCHAALLFGVLDPAVSKEDVGALANAMVQLFTGGPEPAELEMLRAELSFRPSAAEPGWEQGYRLADEVHNLLGEVNVERVLVESIIDRLSIHRGEIRLSDDHVRGVSFAGPEHHPAILVNRTHPRNDGIAGERFTLVHELAHVLVDRTRGQKLAVASGPWAPQEVEQRANAFAAYLLMPPELVQRAISTSPAPPSSAEGLAHIAETLGTSRASTVEHLYNLGLIDDMERDELRADEV